MSEESLVSKICKCLEILVEGKKTDSSPVKSLSKDKKEALFNELKRNVHYTFEHIVKYEDLKLAIKKYITICHKKKCKTCDYLNFLELSLLLLKLLSEALQAEEIEQSSNETKNAVPKGLLSISQQKILKKCLQFTVALGILPNLLRGIGIPLCRRLEYAKMMEHFITDITPRQKQAQIVICLDVLLSCLDRNAMQGIILTYHGTDLLAAWFQVCHAPIKKIETKNETLDDSYKDSMGVRNFASKLAAMKDYSSFTDQQLVNEMIEDRNYFTPKLERFLKQLCPSLLMWELLLFQGIPIKNEESDMAISKVPLWLRKICTEMLTDMILQNHGVSSFVQVVLDKAYDLDLHHSRIDSSRLDAIARLIVYNPVRHITLEEYINKLSKQVLEMLHVKNVQMEHVLKYLAATIIFYTCERDMKSAEKYLLNKLFQPLWMCVSTTAVSKIVVQEKVLSHCIEDIYKLYIGSESPLSRKYIKCVFPFFHCFANMYFFMVEGISTLKTKVKHLLLHMLKNASNEDAISLLHAALFSSVDDKGTLVYMTTVDFAYGEEGGIGAVIPEEDDFSDLDINCRAVLGLLSELKNKDLNRGFLLLVLKVFCSYRNVMLQCPDDPKYERFRYLFAALMMELPQWDIDVREALMSNVSEVTEILVALMDIVLKWEDEECDETMVMIISIVSSHLNTLMSGNKDLTHSEWSTLKKCLPNLEKLMKKPMDEEMKCMILYIIERLATHGTASDNTNLFEEMMQNCILKLLEESNDVSKQSKEVQPSSSINQISKKPSVGANSSLVPEDFVLEDKMLVDICGLASELLEKVKLMYVDVDDSSADAYSAFVFALEHMKNPEVPVQGHGLIAVKKLICYRDAGTLSFKEDLVSLFQTCIEHEDSYIYLTAIDCLGALGGLDPKLVLPVLLNAFQNNCDEKPEFALKIGEVIKKVSGSLGDIIHKFKDQLLHTCLVGTKHEDSQIRSSSLSNLGEICLHLNCHISGPWLQEILMCVHSMLRTDRDLEVQRAAVTVIRSLLKGVGRDLLQVLENEIKEIYRELKMIYTTASDDVLRLQSQLALEEINVIMKDLFTIKLPLTKEIRILR